MKRTVQSKSKTSVKVKNPAYSPSKYTHYPNMCEEVRHLAMFGCTNEEIATFYNLALPTFERYHREIPELRAALEKGRLMDSMKVVDSLHRQALGYQVIETEEAEHMDKYGEIHVLKKTVTKHVQPNVTAAIYLLKTRHGDKWMDVVKSEQTKNLNIMVKNVDFSDVTDEELQTLKKIGIRSIPTEFHQKGNIAAIGAGDVNKKE